MPTTGWLKAVRLALGMSLSQVADRLSITKQSVSRLEKREQEGSITINTLREAANSLDMQLVYGFIPKDGSLAALIDRKAEELAKKIVARSSQTMKLEDQENSESRLKEAVADRKEIIKTDLPKILWD